MKHSARLGREAAEGPDAFFVYGTLRPGQHNFLRISRLVVETEPATLPDHVLYGRGLPFPYALAGAGRVVGNLLRISPEKIPEALGIDQERDLALGELRRQPAGRALTL